MLELTMLPADDGDCLVLAYGPAADRRRMLIDGGRLAAYRAFQEHVLTLPHEERHLELMVVTHVDEDHVKGALALAEDPGRPVDPRQVWFNAYAHLRQAMGEMGTSLESFGAVQGERLSSAILANAWPWNGSCSGGPVMRRDGAVDVLELDGGIRLTLLSPSAAKLARLEPTWRAEVLRAGLQPSSLEPPRPMSGEFERLGGVDVEALARRPDRTDRTVANGSSIAFVAEWDGARILFAADAHPDVLEEALAPLAKAEGGRYRVDLMKVPHHGSALNVSRSLLGMIDCERFAFSTDGSRHGHPDAEAVAKILVHCSPGQPKVLIFNYRGPGTEPWDDAGLRARYLYSCEYPDPARPGWNVVRL